MTAVVSNVMEAAAVTGRRGPGDGRAAGGILQNRPPGRRDRSGGKAVSRNLRPQADECGGVAGGGTGGAALARGPGPAGRLAGCGARLRVAGSRRPATSQRRGASNAATASQTRRIQPKTGPRFR